MTKLTLLQNSIDFTTLMKNAVRGWDWNQEKLNNSQHGNCLRLWYLYDIEVIRRSVYLNLTAAWMAWVAVR